MARGKPKTRFLKQVTEEPPIREVTAEIPQGDDGEFVGPIESPVASVANTSAPEPIPYEPNERLKYDMRPTPPAHAVKIEEEFPEPTYADPSAMPNLVKYDWLSSPIGRLDFENAGQPFRLTTGRGDQKFIEQFAKLLAEGYEIAPGGFVPSDGKVYFLFMKK